MAEQTARKRILSGQEKRVVLFGKLTVSSSPTMIARLERRASERWTGRACR